MGCPVMTDRDPVRDMNRISSARYQPVLAPAGRPDCGPADEPGLMTQIIRFSCARGRDGRAERRLRCAGRVGPPDRAWPSAAALRAVLPGGAAWPWSSWRRVVRAGSGL